MECIFIYGWPDDLYEMCGSVRSFIYGARLSLSSVGLRETRLNRNRIQERSTVYSCRIRVVYHRRLVLLLGRLPHDDAFHDSDESVHRRCGDVWNRSLLCILVSNCHPHGHRV
ncbi:hypothetical protein D3C85_1418370 [compost metagenome]